MTSNDAKASGLICFCNRVSRSTVEDLIRSGKASSLTEIYDQCGAGVGPCGGSCRDSIESLIQKQSPSIKAPAAAPEEPELTPELVESLSLFNRRYYWETHEVLEDLWREENGSRKLFLQGLIQAAAALYHVLNSNPTGVLKLAQASLEKLKKTHPNPFAIDCTEVFKALEFYQEEAKANLANEKIGFDYARLPKLYHGKRMVTAGQKAGD